MRAKLGSRPEQKGPDMHDVHARGVGLEPEGCVKSSKMLKQKSKIGLFG